MKKKIGFVPMDPVLGAWLLEMLAKEPPVSENAGELCAGVQDLLRGEVTSLLLSASGEGEAPSPAESLQLGELEIFPKSRRVPGQLPFQPDEKPQHHGKGNSQNKIHVEHSAHLLPTPLEYKNRKEDPMAKALRFPCD